MLSLCLTCDRTVKASSYAPIRTIFTLTEVHLTLPLGLKCLFIQWNYDGGDTTSVYVRVLHNHAQLQVIDHSIDQIHEHHTCPGACRGEEIKGQSRNISLYAENINWKMIMKHFFLWMILKKFKVLCFYAFKKFCAIDSLIVLIGPKKDLFVYFYVIECTFMQLSAYTRY